MPRRAAGLQGTLDVLKGACTRFRPGASAPAEERELYDSARHLLVGENRRRRETSPCTSPEDNLDYALWPPSGHEAQGRAAAARRSPVPGSSAVAARPASRAADDEMDDEMGFGEVDAEGSGEPKDRPGGR